MIKIESKRKKQENILREYPGAVICDVTSRATDGLVRLSPFYPHGGIPVPFSEGYSAMSVEGIWQGLKVFEGENVDLELLHNSTMKNLKRSVRTHGRVLGHRRGVHGTEILGYVEAKRQIYLPTYRWVLENKVQDIVERMREASRERTIVLLDYNTCCEVDSATKPLSHAYLVKAYVEGLYPYGDKQPAADTGADNKKGELTLF